MSEQKLPQFPSDMSGRGEEKVVTWEKNPVTIVCSQMTAINFSISANSLWLWQQESKSGLPPLLRVWK